MIMNGVVVGWMDSDNDNEGVVLYSCVRGS